MRDLLEKPVLVRRIFDAVFHVLGTSLNLVAGFSGDVLAGAYRLSGCSLGCSCCGVRGIFRSHFGIFADRLCRSACAFAP